MKFLSKLALIFRSSLAPFIVLAGITLITACSDKEKIAKQAIENEKLAKLTLEKTVKIKDLKEKLIEASFKGDSFLFISTAEELQKLDGLDDNHVREKLGHESIIKNYIEGISRFLWILENDEISTVKNTESSNPYQSSVDSATHIFECLANNSNQLYSITNVLEELEEKSSLTEDWKKAEKSFCASNIGYARLIINFGQMNIKSTMDLIVEGVAITTEHARISGKNPWDLHATGGSDQTKEAMGKIPKMSDCKFDRILTVISKMNSSHFKDIKNSLLDYYKEQSNVYAEVESPSSVPWGRYVSYIREHRDRIIEKGDVCGKELLNLQNSLSSQKTVVITQDLINNLPITHRVDLQIRLDQVIAKEQAKLKDKK